MNTAPAALVGNGGVGFKCAEAVMLMDAPFCAWYKCHNDHLVHIIAGSPGFIHLYFNKQTEHKSLRASTETKPLPVMFIAFKEDNMVKEIVKDSFLLMKRSSPATKDDLAAARDLADTLMAHSLDCAGMAANMIGVFKNIIAVNTAGLPLVMLNPRIVSHSGESYETEEGCLSLEGTRPVKRWSSIDVEYFDMSMKKHRNSYSGFTAQVIQHEIDHCSGILI